MNTALYRRCNKFNITMNYLNQTTARSCGAFLAVNGIITAEICMRTSYDSNRSNSQLNHKLAYPVLLPTIHALTDHPMIRD